jgi:hypothetical protein
MKDKNPFYLVSLGVAGETGFAGNLSLQCVRVESAREVVHCIIVRGSPFDRVIYSHLIRRMMKRTSSFSLLPVVMAWPPLWYRGRE